MVIDIVVGICSIDEQMPTITGHAMQSGNPLEDSFDLVIFDCDGVLVDSEVISCSTLAETMSLFGVPCDLPNAMRRYMGRPASAITDDFIRLSGNALPPEFTHEWHTRLYANLSELQPITGVRSFVEGLKTKYCVASSSDEHRIEYSLRQTGLFDLFDERIFSTTMVKNGKPAPDLFILAASSMGAEPARCLVIEDSRSGVIAAKAAGMTACGFSGGSHFALLDLTEDLRRAGADFVVKSLADVNTIGDAVQSAMDLPPRTSSTSKDKDEGASRNDFQRSEDDAETIRN